MGWFEHPFQCSFSTKVPNFRACKNAKFALQHPIIFGVLVSPWTTLKTEKRKLACSWEMKSVSGHLKFDKARCLFTTFLRLQGNHYCECAQKWCHFSYFLKTFQTKKFKKLRPKMTKTASRGPALMLISARKTLQTDLTCSLETVKRNKESDNAIIMNSIESMIDNNNRLLSFYLKVE